MFNEGDFVFIYSLVHRFPQSLQENNGTVYYNKLRLFRNEIILSLYNQG